MVAVGYLASDNEWDSTLQIWDLESGTIVHQLSGETGTVTAVAALPGARVAYCGFRPTVKVWDYEAGNVQREFRSTGKGALVALDAWEDGRGMVTGGEDGSLRLW